MGDHSTETLELRIRRKNEAHAPGKRLLGGYWLHLDEDDSRSWMLNHIDCFVSQSRGNKIVQHVSVNASFDGYGDDVWEKVGQAIGNLQALETLHISNHDYDDELDSDEDDDEDEDSPIDWELVARILRHVRQSVAVDIENERLRTIEEVQPFARAIYGHPTITGFRDTGMFPYESLGTLFSTLTTLPALESVMFGAPEVNQADESTLANPGSLTELLRVPTLRSVHFHHFSFTPALFRATANALVEGTAVTKLEFISCSFSAVECDVMMANGLRRNTSVISIRVVRCNNARTLFDALAAALPSNSTLRHLELFRSDSDCLSSVISALGQNTGLKSLKVDGFDPMDESLCTAIQNGLGMNESLEILELGGIHVTDDNSDVWGRAFSFLRTNKTLKSV
jgi:hypothetical protein